MTELDLKTIRDIIPPPSQLPPPIPKEYSWNPDPPKPEKTVFHLMLEYPIRTMVIGAGSIIIGFIFGTDPLDLTNIRLGIISWGIFTILLCGGSILWPKLKPRPKTESNDAATLSPKIG